MERACNKCLHRHNIDTCPPSKYCYDTTRRAYFIPKKKPLKTRMANMLEDHITIGKLTIFGDNAMHFGCHYWTKKFGYICWRLPLPCGIADVIRYGKKHQKIYWKPLYFWISRNATPWASVFFIGKKANPKEWALSRVRKVAFGWNYDSDNPEHYERLLKIRNIL